MKRAQARKNIDSVANEILDLLDRDTPAAAATQGDPVQNAMSAISRARDAGGGAVRQSYLAEARKHMARIDPVRQHAALQNLQGHVLALHGRGRDTSIAHVTRL